MTNTVIPFDVHITSKILEAMIAAARAGEDVIRGGAARRSSLEWQTKSASDYLTEVDTTSEDVIRRDLLSALGTDFPDMRVLGEETWKDEPTPPGLSFVVDPLDGTTNFLHGLPAFCVSIAALHDGEPIVAVILDIPHAELFTAVLGRGARLNDEPIRVSTIAEPARSLIGTGFPFGENAQTVRYARQFIPVANATSGIRRVGSAAIDLAWVAAGRFDAFWELDLAPWDIAAGILLVREAGGIVTEIDGKRAGIDSSPLVAGNHAMHEWLIHTLRQADASA